MRKSDKTFTVYDPIQIFKYVKKKVYAYASRVTLRA